MKLISRLLGSAVLVGASLGASIAIAAPFSQLVIFGDSLSDTGNNSQNVNIGADPLQPITGNTYIPVKTYSPAPTGTYSNGPVWATQFAAATGLSAIAATTPGGGTNYAFGGAQTSGGQVPSLIQQTNFFLQAAGNADQSNTLFVVAGGGNNARDTAGHVSGPSDPQLSADATQYATDIGTIVDQLQAKGAAHIVVWNVPNIGLTPFANAFGPQAMAFGAFVANSFNSALTNRLVGEDVQVYDIYARFTQLVAATTAVPGSTVFTNVKDACGAASNSAACLDISQALFWDGIHPTTAGHSVIANDVLALVAAPVPEPSEVAMMFVGLLVVVRVALRKKAG